MDRGRFQQVESLFHAAVELPSEQRSAFIRAECGEDDDFAKQVERMLRFHESPGATQAMHVGATDAFATDDDPNGAGDGDDPLIGRQIDHYQVIDRLGEGGFGDVYVAEQLRPVRRRVAMKIIRAAVGAKRVLARFQSERQALAMMDHPNIASIHDAGETDAALGSRPYVVMELVEGDALTTFCDDRRLNIAERIGLFLQVCRGVQHAHQKGVVHRDLKPSNVVVTEHDGVPLPKIIDFGIAKVIDEPLTDAAPVTEIRQMIGTPQYMSPEQAAGSSQVDTRTDIYSLGAMLYELLTGQPPVDVEKVRSASFAELQQMICDRVPARPSTRFATRTGESDEAASQRGQDATSLRRLLRGEVDWIVMKALEHDPAGRYSTASEFAADLERFLRHEPVLAGPPSHSYRIRKFIRRHRMGVAAALLVITALIVGVVGLGVGLIRANESAARANAVNDFMRDVLTSVEPDRDGADVRLVEVLSAASESVPARFAGQPMQQAAVRDMLGQVCYQLGQFADAVTELRHAIDLYRAHIGPNDPRTLEAQRHVASALLNLSRFSAAERELDDLYDRDLALFGPKSAEALQTRRMRAVLTMMDGAYDSAAADLREIIADAEPLGADHPIRLAALGSLVRVLSQHAGTLRGDERLATANEGYEYAIPYLEALDRDEDTSLTQVLIAKIMLAELCYNSGRFDECVSTCHEVQDRAKDRYETCHWLFVESTATMRPALFRLGRYDESGQAALDVIDCVRTHVAEDNPIYLGALNDALPFLDACGRFQEGEQFARRLIEAFSAFAGSSHGSSTGFEIFLARFVSRQGRFDEAENLFQGVLAREDELPADIWRAQLRLYYGRHLADQGQFERAETEMNRAADLAGGLYVGTHVHDPHDVIRELIALYEAWGRPDQAERCRQLLRDAGDPAI